MAARAEIVLEEAELNHSAEIQASLWPGLERLDLLLAGGIEAAQALFGPGAMADGFRGLYLNRADVDRLVARAPGEPLLHMRGSAPSSPHPLAWLSHLLPGLDDFDLDVILIALGPELDLRYERLYAYLQDDITRKRPTVDLALNLLCSTSEERLARRSHFNPEAPLIRYTVLDLISDPSQIEPPLLASYFKLDEEMVSLLLGQDSLGRLSTFCEWLAPQAGELDDGLAKLARKAHAARRPLRLYFQGAPGAGKRRAAQAMGAATGATVLAAQLASPSFAADPHAPVRLTRAARLCNAILYLDGWDAVSGDQAADLQDRMLAAVSEFDGIAVLAGTRAWNAPHLIFRDSALGILPVTFGVPAPVARRTLWRASLWSQGIDASEDDVATLAGRFRLMPAQISEAAAAARSLLEQRGGEEARLAGLMAAARAQSGHALAALTTRIEPVYAWDDIVLPDDALAQLREICQRVASRERVMGDWGFES
ncbi:MAG: hypothetical protein ACM3JD_07475, partial [Rudaea sp.]